MGLAGYKQGCTRYLFVTTTDDPKKCAGQWEAPRSAQYDEKTPGWFYELKSVACYITITITVNSTVCHCRGAAGFSQARMMVACMTRYLPVPHPKVDFEINSFACNPINKPVVWARYSTNKTAKKPRNTNKGISHTLGSSSVEHGMTHQSI